MTKRSLLIIGAGAEQIYAYKLAKKMGLLVIGSDINPNAPAREYSDHFILASARDVSSTINAVKKFNQEIAINGVLTLANDVPLTVATVAKELKLPGIPIDLAELSSNKLKMKECFQSNGIATAPFEVVETLESINKFADKWGYPIVIKPNDGRGARGVLRITSKMDEKWFKHAIDNSDNSWLLVEKYIDGKQLSTESLVYKGKCYTASISQRNYDLLDLYSPFIIENGGVIPADLDTKQIESIENIINSTAKALKLNSGTIKGDIVLSKDGPVVIEVALRLSGGYLCTDQIPITRGVDLVEQSIKLALGEPLNSMDLIPQDICKMGIRYFFPKPGRIIEINGFRELKQFNWITKKELFVDIGDTIHVPKNHSQRVGFVHAIGDSFAEAEQRAILASKAVEIKTIPINLQ